jgi:DNA topoisomerase I
VLAAAEWWELPPARAGRQANRNVVRAVESVAERLGNTPAICRRCYVHPAVIEAYLDGSLLNGLKRPSRRSSSGLPPEEAAVLELVSRTS